jgi:hypothetical protein
MHGRMLSFSGQTSLRADRKDRLNLPYIAFRTAHIGEQGGYASLPTGRYGRFPQLPVANHEYCPGKDGRVSFYPLNKKGGDENVAYADTDISD